MLGWIVFPHVLPGGALKADHRLLTLPLPCISRDILSLNSTQVKRESVSPDCVSSSRPAFPQPKLLAPMWLELPCKDANAHLPPASRDPRLLGVWAARRFRPRHLVDLELQADKISVEGASNSPSASANDAAAGTASFTMKAPERPWYVQPRRRTGIWD